MNDAQQLTVRFMEAFSRGNQGMIDAIRRYFTPDTVWENVGLATTTGIDEALGLVKQLEASMGIDTIHIEVLAIASDGHKVLTERIDRMLRADGSEIAAPPVMGIFEIEEGRIKAWRDYFDSAAALAMAG